MARAAATVAMAVGVTIAVGAALQAPNGRPAKPATSTTGAPQATPPSATAASWQPIGLPAGFRATALSCPTAGVCVLLGAIDSAQTVEEYAAGSWSADVYKRQLSDAAHPVDEARPGMLGRIGPPAATSGHARVSVLRTLLRHYLPSLSLVRTI